MTSWLLIYTMDMNIKVFIKASREIVIQMKWNFKCKEWIYFIDLSPCVTDFDEYSVDRRYGLIYAESYGTVY